MTEENLQTFVFHAHGLHCASCAGLIEGELGELANVKAVKVTLSANTVAVTADFGEQSMSEAADTLSAVIKPHGYSLSVEPIKPTVNWSEFKIAIPLTFLLALIFILLQKSGLINLVSTGSVSYGTAFVIGVVASLSTCMAVVGGLVLSLSANLARGKDAWRPQVLFHLGRIISFFVLGGVIGAIGSTFKLSITMTFGLGVVIGLVMLGLGLNLLDIFPWARRLQLALPKVFTAKAGNFAKARHSLTPLLAGGVTFFLPCGFTQAMQLYTLSTGSFLTGAGTMLAFALGTLPVLALLSFGSLSLAKHRLAGIFFKTAGLVVIMFGLFNLINSLVIMGWIAPVFNF
ncbi:MAG: hypothetical protein A2571_01025 [Candidatus Vogelbacteria bacterium RIFOXYD1_FULL_44_32]|uniref:HMA domain-containing protein n=1 Tax=Candidatus Vogelbacteria bacterium RIFOXYD1_FULL_44_32 TaxID=1802438 RepID=A0A1G2QG45_9BACT|nr:MAG: hypothetical protein A2571_01025 [Candidatus Vogelbacteria bacterium RIFOXYD1_FULL_44_32]